jgi:cytochrome oxidase assembly protein ShyY1
MVKPGWLISLLFVGIFVYLCFTMLAPWQLNKYEDLEARNDQLVESSVAGPIPLDEVIRRDGPLGASEWHLVTARGSYLPTEDVLLRMQSVDGKLVYQTLSAFRTDSGDTLLVNRGWVRVGDNNAVPDFPSAPTGQLTITARLRIPMNAPAQPIVLHDWNMVRNIDPPAIGDLLGTDLTPYYLQLASGQPGSLEPMPVPSVESGPYLSYGLQWMTFGVVAPLGLVYFVWSELRQRRRLDDEDNDAAEARPQGGNRAAGPGEDATASLPAPSGVPTTTGGDEGTPDEAADSDQLVAAAMRDRYGDRFASEQRRSWRRGNRFDV